MCTTVTIRHAGTSPADYQAFTDFYHLVGADDEPTYMEQSSLEDLRAFDRACERSGVYSQRYLAQLPDGTIAGIGHFFSVNWLPEPGTYWTIVRVRPDVQRRGIGTALLQHMQAELAALGAHTMWLMVPEEAEHLLPVFERRGFRERMRTNPFVLDVATCPPLDLDSRLAKLGNEHGLRVSTLRECMAEDADWLDKVYALHAAVTREVPLPEKIFTNREEFAEFAVQSPQALFDAFFVVRDGDAYVGLSFMQRNDDTPDTLYQELTGNLPAYRGKGLARILKLLTIDYALRHGYQKIVTWMENNNAGMLAINLSYGFVREIGLVLLERPVVARLQLPVGSVQQFNAEVAGYAARSTQYAV